MYFLLSAGYMLVGSAGLLSLLARDIPGMMAATLTMGVMLALEIRGIL